MQPFFTVDCSTISALRSPASLRRPVPRRPEEYTLLPRFFLQLPIPPLWTQCTSYGTIATSTALASDLPRSLSIVEYEPVICRPKSPALDPLVAGAAFICSSRHLDPDSRHRSTLALRCIPGSFTARSPLPASPPLPRRTPRPTSARLRLPGLPSAQQCPHTPEDHSITAMHSTRRRRSLSTTASPSPVPFTTSLIVAIPASGSTPTPLMRGEPALFSCAPQYHPYRSTRASSTPQAASPTCPGLLVLLSPAPRTARPNFTPPHPLLEPPAHSHHIQLTSRLHALSYNSQRRPAPPGSNNLCCVLQPHLDSRYMLSLCIEASACFGARSCTCAALHRTRSSLKTVSPPRIRFQELCDPDYKHLNLSSIYLPTYSFLVTCKYRTSCAITSSYVIVHPRVPFDDVTTESSIPYSALSLILCFAHRGITLISTREHRKSPPALDLWSLHGQSHAYFDAHPVHSLPAHEAQP
ncbi:hypothetical protein B0H13DRAFT_2357627 [Mycena leptocephala]|nr:hypothetical protein B0H13DRAFT_2357627 [Mycena leptocephala]